MVESRKIMEMIFKNDLLSIAGGVSKKEVGQFLLALSAALISFACCL